MIDQPNNEDAKASIQFDQWFNNRREVAWARRGNSVKWRLWSQWPIRAMLVGWMARAAFDRRSTSILRTENDSLKEQVGRLEAGRDEWKGRYEALARTVAKLREFRASLDITAPDWIYTVSLTQRLDSILSTIPDDTREEKAVDLLGPQGIGADFKCERCGKFTRASMMHNQSSGREVFCMDCGPTPNPESAGEKCPACDGAECAACGFTGELSGYKVWQDTTLKVGETIQDGDEVDGLMEWQPVGRTLIGTKVQPWETGRFRRPKQETGGEK